MTLVRDGNVLHILSDNGVMCGATAWKLHDNQTVERDDLLCGRCLDLNAPTVSALEFGDETVLLLRTLSYDAYLRSHHWQTTRRAALDHYGPACAMCGQTDGIEVHHRTYTRRGEERLHDLTVLCRACHGRFHTEAA